MNTSRNNMCLYENKQCEICGAPAKNFMFGSFICNNTDCIEKAKILRGGPAGHKLRVVNIGSENPVKIKAVEEVMSNTIGNVLVKGINVDSGVSPQPIGLEETSKGAINRAKEAFNSKSCLYGVGIEAGLIEMGGKYLDIHVCAIYNGLDYTVGSSRGFELPKEIVTEIKKGVECSIAVQKQYNIEDIGQNEGIIGYITNGALNRIDLCKDAVLSAMIPRLKL